MTADLEDLISARSNYLRDASGNYDEVLVSVSHSISTTGSVGKADIGALVFWKRLRADTPWASKLNDMADQDVRAITSAAVQAVCRQDLAVHDCAKQGRSALTPLPGFQRGDALASAILTAAAPTRMAVYDQRAHAGLNQLGIKLTDTPGRYGRYMEIIEDLCKRLADRDQTWTARDVDTALYTLGKPSGRPDPGDR